LSLWLDDINLVEFVEAVYIVDNILY